MTDIIDVSHYDYVPVDLIHSESYTNQNLAVQMIWPLMTRTFLSELWKLLKRHDFKAFFFTLRVMAVHLVAHSKPLNNCKWAASILLKKGYGNDGLSHYLDVSGIVWD